MGFKRRRSSEATLGSGGPGSSSPGSWSPVVSVYEDDDGFISRRKRLFRSPPKKSKMTSELLEFILKHEEAFNR
jgi:hypothetical protein